MMDQIQPTIPPFHWQKPMARVMQKNSFLLQQVEEENMVPEPAERTLEIKQRMADILVSSTTDFLHSMQQISQQPLSPILSFRNDFYFYKVFAEAQSKIQIPI